jgi:small subunit ribosomal protein S2
MSTQNRLLRTAFLLGVGAALGALAIIWLLRLLREEEETERADRVPSPRPEEYNIPIPLEPEDLEVATPPAPKTRRPAVERLATPEDDLTRIDGIGPKYADGLRKLGISSYAALATQQPNDLAANLKELGLRVIGDRIVSEDWVGQAQRLAGQEG